jgi:hypothetical protein
MEPNLNPTDPQPPSANSNPAPEAPPLAPPDPPADPPHTKRRNGFVARKTKLVRDRLNILMRDGLTYKEIITELGNDGAGLTEGSLTSWRHGGHQDWLKEQEALAEWSGKWEFAKDLVDRDHGLTIHQVLNQTLASHIHEVINDAGPSVIHNALNADPRNIIPLIQAISALSQAGLDCERYRHLDTAQNQSPTGSDPKSIKSDTIKKIEKDLNLL